jgi:cobaltochelatase CobS
MLDFNASFSHIPHTLHKASDVFNINCTWDVPVLKEESEHIPDINPHYHFEEVTTKAILAGFLYNRRVLLQGLHGTGKSTHIEQVAARLRWPLIRINLDGHISRFDLIGRDSISLKEDKQITEFKEGMLPWAMRRPCALLFDEYDAARPDVMFVLQRILEAEGKLTLLDQSSIITPHPAFRLFATANTLGMGDTTGMYHGTNPINQGQLDRWHIMTKLDYLAGLIRAAFKNEDIARVMSPRNVIHFAENMVIFEDVAQAFRFAFFNRCDENDISIIAECFHRVFNIALPEMAVI